MLKHLKKFNFFIDKIYLLLLKSQKILLIRIPSGPSQGSGSRIQLPKSIQLSSRRSLKIIHPSTLTPPAIIPKGLKIAAPIWILRPIRVAKVIIIERLEMQRAVVLRIDLLFLSHGRVLGVTLLRLDLLPLQIAPIHETDRSIRLLFPRKLHETIPLRQLRLVIIDDLSAQSSRALGLEVVEKLVVSDRDVKVTDVYLEVSF